MQCGHAPDPAERQEDAPEDALWDLASDFHARGDDAAYRRTLETIVKRYPSSRRAEAARLVLGDAG